MDVNGSCNFTSNEIKLQKFYIWPLSHVTFKPSNEQCPIRKIKLFPANNQKPICVDCKLFLNEKPQVDIECINVCKIIFSYKK